MEEARAARMVDVAFGLGGRTLPRDHRCLLASALEAELPWLREAPGSGVHGLKLVPGDSGQDLLSGRTRLVLRVPRERAGEAAALSGTALDLAGHRLEIGAAQSRELVAWGTLYAHFVAADGADEAAFLAAVQAQLDSLQVRARPICGRWRTVEANALLGCSLMLDGLAGEDSLRVLEQGLGRHRRLGCGLFVPHRSAAAVGSPP